VILSLRELDFRFLPVYYKKLLSLAAAISLIIIFVRTKYLDNLVFELKIHSGIL